MPCTWICMKKCQTLAVDIRLGWIPSLLCQGHGPIKAGILGERGSIISLVSLLTFPAFVLWFSLFPSLTRRCSAHSFYLWLLKPLTIHSFNSRTLLNAMKSPALLLIAALAVHAAPIVLPQQASRPTYAISRRGFFDDIGSAIGGLFGGSSSSSSGSTLGKIGSVLGSVLDKDKSTSQKIGDIAGAVLGDSKEGSAIKKVGDVLGTVLDKDKSTGDKIGSVVGAVLGDAKEGSTAKKIGDVVGAVLDKDASTGDKIDKVAGAVFGEGSKIDKVADAVGAVVDKDGDAGKKIGAAVGAVLNKGHALGGKIGDVVGAVLDKGASTGDKIDKVAGAVFGEGSKIDKVADAVGAVVDKDADAGKKIGAAVGAVLEKEGGVAGKVGDVVGRIVGGPPAATAVASPAASTSSVGVTSTTPSSTPTDTTSPAPTSSAKAASSLSASPSPAATAQPNVGGETCAANAPILNGATIDLIKSFEGFVASPKPDPIGVPTVGFGHLCQRKNCAEVPFSFPLTQDTAASLLQNDANKFTSCLSRLITNSVKLNDNQFGALTAWAFNVGCRTVGKSTLVKRLNKGEDVTTVVAQELPKFNKAGGKVLKGLTRRRKAEVQLARTPSSTIAHPTC
ncbi:hypothetical protein D9611_012414 [Ephemerocybe angulata]|uniref:Lysozyme n=1 Tax=Ephemerocybe angulata TaxID=980116 RepID=A0A8H5CG85_9AGAR|nr:hypothetical protein D9611_012414 [Tulosesus angulatus]